MNAKMKYGSELVDIPVDEKNVAQIIKSNAFEVTKSEEEIIEDALKHPIDSARLKELVRAGQTVCIVIPDVTRAWQKTDKYLYKIVDELNEAGVKDEDITFLSATGTHRKQSKEEHDLLLGEKLSKRFQVIDHDCKDTDNMVYLGKTSFGTPVSINKVALECDHIVITGAIIYHFLVGWSGGKKTLLPGISSYETVMANHSLSLSKKLGDGVYPTVRSGNTESNPVHMDMLEAASFIRPTFMFNVIVNKDSRIIGAVAGNYISAHAKGREIVDAVDGVDIKEKAEITIASAGGYPKDINLYQSIKTLINAREATKEGGTIIILTECREGIGGDKDIKDIILNYNSLLDREKAVRENYTISKFVGFYLCETAYKFNLILVSKIDPNLVKTANITVVKTIEEAVELTYKTNSKDAKITLMPNAANTLPKLKIY